MALVKKVKELDNFGEFQSKKGLVTIIIPAYNREFNLKKSIESILAQTYENWELIIVDDCSTDNTQELVSKYQSQDKRISYSKLEKNSGACVARNTGIAMAKGEYITFLDSDDEYYPEKIAKQIAHFKNSADNNLAVVSCGAVDFRDNIEYNRRMPLPKKDIYRALLGKEKNIGAGTPFLMVRTDIIRNNNLLFDPKMPAMQDWDFLIRIVKNYNFEFVAEYLVKVNHHTNDRVYNSKNATDALIIQYRKYLSWLQEDGRAHLSFVKNAATLIALYKGISEGKNFLDASITNFNDRSLIKKLKSLKIILDFFRIKYFKLFYLKYFR